MNVIRKELEYISNAIIETFTDPFEDKSLFEFLSQGSKLIRSTIALLYLKAQNVEITQNICNILVAGEIIHNASLLHDDVIDEADFRRKKITISKKHNPTISVLAGDFLLSLAIEKLLELDNKEILKIFKNCTKKMAETEIRQYFLRNKVSDKNAYLEICYGKTAVLFSAILESVAIISEVSIDKAKEFAKFFGICFQIQNDMKQDSKINDKQNGIYTAEDILGIEKTLNLLDNYKEKMCKLLEEFPENIYKEELEGLINSL